MKTILRFITVITQLGLIIGGCSSICKADWINLSGAENAPNIAEIFVEDDHVKLKLEIFVQDLKTFQELIPDRLLNTPSADRPSLEERLRLFSVNTFQIIDDNGKNLTARADLIEPRMRVERPSPFAGTINPYTRQPIPGPPADKRVLYVELTYPFAGNHPSSLIFYPPMDENGNNRASVGFVCYHKGVTVVDFRQLVPGSTLHLDWHDPWYSAFKKRQYQRKLQSGVRTYLYIEPYEVRHEILVRVKDMMNWMDFSLRGSEFIEEDEFDPVRKKVAQFFMERENVLIDGNKIKPILDRTAYVESAMLRSRFIEIPERVPLNTAMIGIIITYLTDGIPDEVETRWDLFSDRVKKVTGSMIDPAGPFPYDLEPDDNVLKWTNYLKSYTLPTIAQTSIQESHRGVRIPLGSIFCGFLIFPLLFITLKRRKQKLPYLYYGISIIMLVIAMIVLTPLWQIPVGSRANIKHITEDDTRAIVNSLLKNIYRAFDFREESDVYDKLAVSVSGELLNDIYLQSRKSLIIEQAGGAQAKVQQVDVSQASVSPSKQYPGAVEVHTQWSIIGNVGHWGHIHTRQNVYEAKLTMEIKDESWKLVAIELLDEKRVDPYSSTSRSKP